MSSTPHPTPPHAPIFQLSVLKYMDKLFESIFSSVVQSQSLPSPIKYLFDFLDSRAVGLGVQDPKIVHSWKSNCPFCVFCILFPPVRLSISLQMRFWNQLITNLDYIFDIPLVRNTAFERSFHAFSQAMTYACAPTREKVTSESSCVKVLFAQDIQNQWTRVQNYYREIKAMPEVTTEDMHQLLEQHSMHHTNEFNVSWAVFELYTKYVEPCHDAIVTQLQQEALKQAYTFKSDQTVFSADPDCPHDGLGRPLWNPLQVIDTLNDVKKCMDQAQSRSWFSRDSPSTVTSSTANGIPPCSSPRLVSRMPTTLAHRAHPLHSAAATTSAHLLPGSLCSAYGGHTHPGMMMMMMNMNNFNGGGGSGAPGLGTTTTAPQSSALTNTEYPDTLRSFNTLTTEFAADEASRDTHKQPHPVAMMQPYHHLHHHHCYQVYESHGTLTDATSFVHPSSGIECSAALLPSSTPVMSSDPGGEMNRPQDAPVGTHCLTKPVHIPPPN
ncbi:unnamed protein product [Echinostoma caproni]|uniref:Plexin_cytopl domain-containing protein n=1 Tax=Echinostoma caproni TaxID=27848 RepID=A0A183B8Q8_9TREM|nr:unnamed protein product [Echinostoma caproni]